MCRNIKPLFNFEPPATADEIEAAALQFVRKVSGFPKPSHKNIEAFDKAVVEISGVVKKLLQELTTEAKPHNREEEAAKARVRIAKRFGLQN